MISGIAAYLLYDLFVYDPSSYQILSKAKKVEESEEKVSDWSILHKISDLMVGMLFNYLIVLQVVVYGCIHSNLKYDDDTSFFTIPIYIFFYNVGDFIGKFTPSKFLTDSSIVLHTISFS